jgi:hypothetical protein
MKAIYEVGSENERGLAHWMDRLGMASASDTPLEN